MDSLVSIVKSGIQKKDLINDFFYKSYYPKESDCTNLRLVLYDLWIFWVRLKKLDGTYFFVFNENAELFQRSSTCIKYLLTKQFRYNLNSLDIVCPADKEYLYLYIGRNLSEWHLSEKIVESLLNYHSLHLLYFGNPLKYGRYVKKLIFYKDQIQRHDFDLKDFVIVSSGILGMYGMREPTDIDMVTLEPNYKEICDELIDCHHHVLQTYEITAEELILNPNNYVYWNGIKFAALNVVYRACNNRIETTKKLDGFFIRVIWGEETPSILELTEKRVRHYVIRTTREWKKRNAWIYRVKAKVIFCLKIPYLACRKIYQIIRSMFHEKDKS